MIVGVTLAANSLSPNIADTIYTNTPTSIPHETTNPAAKGYTLAEVEAHNNTASCWAIIGSSVYDLTAWIDQHPGGPETIMSICGKDGTVAFTQQHGGQRKPENELTNFYIGAYAK